MTTFDPGPVMDGGLYFDESSTAAQGKGWKHKIAVASVLRAEMHPSLTKVIDVNSNILNVEFPGVLVGQDGSWSGFSSSGTPSAQALTLVAGQVVTMECEFKLPVAGENQKFMIGSNASNGYGITWSTGGSPNNIVLNGWSGGTSVLAHTFANLNQDTNLHSIKMTITVGSPNVIEVSFDGNTPYRTTDSNVTLTTGTFPFTILDASTSSGMKVWRFHARSAMPHYSELHTAAQAVVSPTVDSHGSNLQHGIVYQEHISGMTGTGNVNLDGLPENPTSPVYTRIATTEVSGHTVKRLNDGSGNVRTAAAVATSMDSSGNGLLHPFGNASSPSGVVESPQGWLTGFSGSPGVSSATLYPTSTTLNVYVDVVLASYNSTIVELIAGSVSTSGGYSGNGVMLKVNASAGTIGIYTVSGGGSPSLVGTAATGVSFVSGRTYRLGLGVDFLNGNVEGWVQQAANPVGGTPLIFQMTPTSASLPFLYGGDYQVPITIADSSGTSTFSNFMVLPRLMAMTMPSEVYVGNSIMNWGTSGNEISLDNVPDGATYAKVKGNGVTSGVVSTIANGTMIGTGSVGLYIHTGTPNGVLSAAQGSICINITGAAGARLYYNSSSGSGTTWTACSGL